MDKKEVLERNKKAAPADEGVVFQDNRARGLGLSAMFLLIALIAVYNLIKGQPSDEVFSILWAGVGVESLYKYKQNKNRTLLVSAVAGILAAVSYLALHIIKTW